MRIDESFISGGGGAHPCTLPPSPAPARSCKKVPFLRMSSFGRRLLKLYFEKNWLLKKPTPECYKGEDWWCDNKVVWRWISWNQLMLCSWTFRLDYGTGYEQDSLTFLKPSFFMLMLGRELKSHVTAVHLPHQMGLDWRRNSFVVCVELKGGGERKRERGPEYGWGEFFAVLPGVFRLTVYAYHTTCASGQWTVFRVFASLFMSCVWCSLGNAPFNSYATVGCWFHQRIWKHFSYTVDDFLDPILSKTLMELNKPKTSNQNFTIQQKPLHRWDFHWLRRWSAKSEHNWIRIWKLVSLVWRREKKYSVTPNKIDE